MNERTFTKEDARTLKSALATLIGEHGKRNVLSDEEFYLVAQLFFYMENAMVRAIVFER